MLTRSTPHRPESTVSTRAHRGQRRRTAHRLAHAAIFSAVRGLAYATGTSTGGIILWWLTHH
jgi:hypothetical protein